MTNYQNEEERTEKFSGNDLLSYLERALKILESGKPTCYSCEYFWEEDDNGYPKNWCMKNNAETTSDNLCDHYKLG